MTGAAGKFSETACAPDLSRLDDLDEGIRSYPLAGDAGPGAFCRALLPGTALYVRGPAWADGDALLQFFHHHGYSLHLGLDQSRPKKTLTLSPFGQPQDRWFSKSIPFAAIRDLSRILCLLPT